MLNPYIIKKWAALMLTGLLTTIGFYIGIMILKSFGIALIIMAVVLLISMFIGNNLLDNPFRRMVEGGGVMAINIDSTGVIRPFLMQVKPPYVEGKLGNKLANDVFDRATVYNLAAPQEAGQVQQGQGEDGKIRIAIVLNEEEYNKGRFALFHYPVIIYNEQLNTIITKEWLSENEKTSFAEHQILYLNRKVEELTSTMRDFGRYVVESLKPKVAIPAGTIIMIVIVIAIILLLILFAPSLMPAIQGMFGGASQAVNNAGSAISTAGG